MKPCISPRKALSLLALLPSGAWSAARLDAATPARAGRGTSRRPGIGPPALRVLLIVPEPTE